MVSKKKKRAEKAKTKLKPKTAPGKHLPKGTNITKTEFKVTKIVIPSQLSRADQSGPITKKKLGLKDVLSKLGHFSQSVRTDGLDGLKELVTGAQGGSLVLENLASIVTKVLPMTSDKEPKLRTSAVTLLEAVLKHVPPPTLEPLHGFLSAHLCCGLSHIDASIQFEGLTLLDSLVTVAPAFVADVYDQLLPNCLAQISSQGKKSSLSTGVSDRISSLKWRTAVLQRLHKILQAVSAHQLSSRESETICNSLSFDSSSTMSCKLYSGLATSGTAEWIGVKDLSNRQICQPTILNHIHLIMPLLIETWVEATATSSSKEKKGSLIPPEVLDLLQCELGVIEQLIHLANLWEKSYGQKGKILSVFESSYLKDFIAHFVCFLPYSLSSTKGTTSHQDCLGENLQLGQLYLSMTKDPSPELLTSLLQLVIKAVAKKQQMVKVVCVVRLLLDTPSFPTQDGERCIELLEREYSSLPLKSAARTAVLDLFIDLILAGRFTQSLEGWVECLGVGLCSDGFDQATSSKILNACLALAKQANKTVIKTFGQNDKKIIGWAESLDDGSYRRNAEQKIKFILYYGGTRID